MAWTAPAEVEQELTRLYWRQGLLAAAVQIGEPKLDPDGAVLPITITEGPVFTIAEIALQGVRSRPEAQVRAALALEPGRPYTSAAAEAARTRLDLDYRRRGFNAVRIALRATANQDAATVSVVVDVDEGPQQLLREIAIAGAETTQAPLVARALGLELGVPVDLGEWNRARKRLYDLGVFRTVDLQAEPLEEAEPPDGAAQPIRAQVVVDEWPAYRLRYGLQLKDEEAPVTEEAERDLRLGVVGDLTRQNLAGRAVTVGTSFRVDTVRQALRGFLTTPAFFGWPITSNVSGSQRRDTFGPSGDQFVVRRSGITLEQRVRPADPLTVAYSYNFERNHTFSKEVDPNDPLGFDVTINVARLDASAIVERRDDIFDATRGWFHSSTVEYAPEVLGSDLRFVKYLAQQFYFRPLGHTIVLASAARLGLARGFGQELIISERFFAGGGNSVRGYREDSLGERDFGKRTALAMFQTSRQMRRPISEGPIIPPLGAPSHLPALA
jgi:outer membrane protein assembly factor BamA